MRQAFIASSAAAPSVAASAAGPPTSRKEASGMCSLEVEALRCARRGLLDLFVFIEFKRRLLLFKRVARNEVFIPSIPKHAPNNVPDEVCRPRHCWGSSVVSFFLSFFVAKELQSQNSSKFYRKRKTSDNFCNRLLAISSGLHGRGCPCCSAGTWYK